jgi:rSAM/selenodomain-associated transferase 1
MKDSLIIFMKNPSLGKVKTRLAADIGDDKALEVYQSLLTKCRQECLKVETNRFLYYHEFVDDHDEWSQLFFQKRKQSKGNLGEKMKSAFADVQSPNGPNPTVIIGTDCYDLDHEMISLAFKALRMTDVVLGPANDGGYYLLGCRHFVPELFEQIDWSTDQVLQQTVMKVNQLGLNYFLLEERIDLDTFDDLKASGFPEMAHRISKND